MCEILIIINLYESKLGVNALVPKREWVCPPADTGSVCRLGVQQNVGKYSTGNQGQRLGMLLSIPPWTGALCTVKKNLAPNGVIWVGESLS